MKPPFTFDPYTVVFDDVEKEKAIARPEEGRKGGVRGGILATGNLHLLMWLFLVCLCGPGSC